MRCPVCGEIQSDNTKKCPKCAFDELHKEFLNKEDNIEWFKEDVIPYGINYILFMMLPHEADIIKLRIGWDDGILRSAEEVAKIYDVCVNRIHQIEAKFIRRFNRLWCSKVWLQINKKED